MDPTGERQTLLVTLDVKLDRVGRGAPDRSPVLRQALDDELAAEPARRQQPVLQAQGADQHAPQRPGPRQVHHLRVAEQM